MAIRMQPMTDRAGFTDSITHFGVSKLQQMVTIQPPVFGQLAWRSQTRREYVRVGSTAASLPPMVLERQAGRLMSEGGGLNSYRKCQQNLAQ
jgi:hypothetical protein